ncbi:unnamed protein product [Chondrus crispus]|uniref:Uncharacterized protein n=1 Tax=Chondrus crispus TaxID=2769 RepID=R7QHV1_CHOCR|nr:unnamed protein product [Chondrus crispus]CDF37353.1 unnamed protein product [Chondrus crispus]|eukprot:XP_005717172.1 unnamed protein product [Chondrus crispus]
MQLNYGRLVSRRQVNSYEATFNLFFLDVRLLNKKENYILATAVDFCVAEGWSLVRSARLFQPFLECLKQNLF